MGKFNTIPGYGQSSRLYLYDSDLESRMILLKGFNSPAILSRSQRYLTFSSDRALSGEADGQQSDLYQVDRQTGHIRSITGGNRLLDRDFLLGPRAVSGTGRFVAFQGSYRKRQPGAGDYQLLLWDRKRHTLRVLSRGRDGREASDGTSLDVVVSRGRVSWSSNSSQLREWCRKRCAAEGFPHLHMD